MKLSEYIKGERGRATTLAERLGISLSHLSQIAADSSSTSPARCVSIEQATEGAVTRKELREDWKAIWPELEAPDAYVGPDRRKEARA